ncbi:MAG: hypothetical protein LBS23_02105 [Holosporaceae bacterium]|jgi:hypothetical protein|nr:hypothetical protein [Holosporaceae bacterium]
MIVGEIYNIPLGEDFLKRVALLGSEKIKLGERYKIFLPSFRSCRELKKNIILLFRKTSFFLPEIRSISDFIRIEDQKIIFLLVRLLWDRGFHASVNALYDLAVSLCAFIRDLVINNVDCNTVAQVVPINMEEYVGHTIGIINDIMKSAEISEAINVSISKINCFIESLQDQKVMAVGIGETNYYTRLFLKNVMNSKYGVLVICGSELQNGKNYQIGCELMSSDVKRVK